VKDLEQNVAEDVLGAAKDGSDLAQDVTEGVLGAAKNGSVMVWRARLVPSAPCEKPVVGAAGPAAEAVDT